MLATRDALAQLRGTIADLTASTAPTSEAAVRLIAHELGHRFDVQVNVRSDADPASTVESGLDLTPRDNLIGATREAIVEAALRGDARHVDVALVRRAGGLVVRASGATHAAPQPQAVGAGRNHRTRRISVVPTPASGQTRRPA